MANPLALEERKLVRSDYFALLTPLRFAGRTRVEFRSGVGHQVVFNAGQRLTADETRELEMRRDRLDELLLPATRMERAAEIARILVVMPSQDLGEAEHLRQGAYQDGLEGEPHFAIVEARKAFFRGEAKVDGRALDKRFAPTPPELAALTREHALPYRQQARRIAALLAATEDRAPPVLDARGRDAIAKKIAAFLSKAPVSTSRVDMAENPRALNVDLEETAEASSGAAEAA